MITGNNISNNDDGIHLYSSSDNNIFYHNNFLDNNQNAYDECDNIWDNGYPSGGNFWDDYMGNDTDGDGIGDTPYPIPSGDSEDRYPLMEPWTNEPPSSPIIDGPLSGNVGDFYDYDFTATDPDGDDVKYYIDWGDGDTEWTSLAVSGTPVIVSHTWAEEDTYTITAKAQDEYGLESDWGTLEVEMPVNQQVDMHPLLQMILERFPNAFPILRYLLGL